MLAVMNYKSRSNGVSVIIHRNMSDHHHNHKHHHHHDHTKDPHAKLEPFQQVHIDDDVLNHWEIVKPAVIEKQGNFKDPKLHAVFRQNQHHKKWAYWAQVKVGHHEHAAEWTVTYTIDGHHGHVDNIELGFKTYY